MSGIDNSKIFWGLIIQGPLVTFGQGGNNVEHGYQSLETINRNIDAFKSRVCKIVVSTWEDSGIELGLSIDRSAVVLENPQPCGNDPDNRRKQFISTQAGLRFLQNNTTVSHVLKIRTDQEVPAEIVDWLTRFFNSEASKKLNCDSTSKLIFSEFVQNEKFFVGDFIFAGKIRDLINFVDANVILKRNFHPCIGIDYLLKHLSVNDRRIYENCFHRMLPLIIQVARDDIEAVNQYWNRVLAGYVSFPPKTLSDEIIWRGRRMGDLGFSHFRYHEDWLDFCTKNKSTITPEAKHKAIDVLKIDSRVLNVLFREYRKQLSNTVKFYLPGLHSFLKEYKTKLGGIS